MPCRQPNIVLFITDHHAYFDHDRPGEFTLKMPHFEALAAQGVRFNRAYSVCPLCSPARASMMTGLYPSAHGLRWNTEAPQQMPKEFRPGQLLYSHYLSQAGYRNAYVGKWHCGHERLPLDYGMEGWSLPDYGKPYMSDAYQQYAAALGLGQARVRVEHNLRHPEWIGQQIVLHHPSPFYFNSGSGVLQGPPAAHETWFVAHLASQKLRELAQRDQPFSLIVSFWAPHHGFYPTEPYASLIDPQTIPEYPTFHDSYQGKPLRHLIQRDLHHGSAAQWPDWRVWQQVLARCYGQILQTDAAIGRVLATLDELGLQTDTLVIYCSDHGDAVASHGGLWDKASTYIEEVARVPLAIRWPARIPAGQGCDRLVSNMDVTATMLHAACGAVPSGMHSRSLLPLCQDPQGATWPDCLIAQHHGHGEDIVQRIIISGRLKYVAALYDMDELYDLETDPHETRNLIDDPDYAETRLELRHRLIEHLEQTSDQPASLLLYALNVGR